MLKQVQKYNIRDRLVMISFISIIIIIIIMYISFRSITMQNLEVVASKLAEL